MILATYSPLLLQHGSTYCLGNTDFAVRTERCGIVVLGAEANRFVLLHTLCQPDPRLSHAHSHAPGEARLAMLARVPCDLAARVHLGRLRLASHMGYFRMPVALASSSNQRRSPQATDATDAVSH